MTVLLASLALPAAAAPKYRPNQIKKAYEAGDYESVIRMCEVAIRDRQTIENSQLIRLLWDDASFALVRASGGDRQMAQKYRMRFKTGRHLAEVLEMECSAWHAGLAGADSMELSDWLALCKDTKFGPEVSAKAGRLGVASLASGKIETVAVEVEGVGETQDEALKSSFTEAVNAVVGTLIDSSQLIENDEVIKDQIFTSSNAFIESYERLGASKQNGLWFLQMRVLVRKSGISNRLRESGMITRDQFDGGDAVTRGESEKKAAENARAMLGRIIEVFTEAKTADVGLAKTEDSYDPVSDTYTYTIWGELRLNRDEYQKQRIRLEDFLETVSTKRDSVFCRLPRANKGDNQCFGPEWSADRGGIQIEVYRPAGDRAEKVHAYRYHVPPGYFDAAALEKADFKSNAALSISVKLTEDPAGRLIVAEDSFVVGGANLAGTAGMGKQTLRFSPTGLSFYRRSGRIKALVFSDMLIERRTENALSLFGDQAYFPFEFRLSKEELQRVNYKFITVEALGQ